MSSCLCDSCAALCCRYFALPIDNPKSARQYDDIRWYLMHENVCVFIEKKQWYLGISNRCKHLQDDNRCGIYLTRPEVCREYSTDNCDYHGGEYDFEKLFTSAEQLREYAEEKLEEAAARARRKRQNARGKVSAAQGKSAKSKSAKGKPAKDQLGRRGVKVNLSRMRRAPNAGAGVALPPVNGNGRNIALPLLRG